MKLNQIKLKEGFEVKDKSTPWKDISMVSKVLRLNKDLNSYYRNRLICLLLDGKIKFFSKPLVKVSSLKPGNWGTP